MALQGGLSHPRTSPFVLCHKHPTWPWASHLVYVTTGAAWGQQGRGWFGDRSSWKRLVRSTEGKEQPVRPTDRCPSHHRCPHLKEKPPNPTWLPWGL